MTAADTPLPYVTAIRAANLIVDHTYQRDLDEARIARMVTDFDRRLLGVLEVSDRGDGTFAILDGQHRHALVLAAVPDAASSAYVVCQVYEGLSVADEARLFHDINIRRKPLSWWDRWRARRGAGDAAVLAIEEVLDHHQLQVNPGQGDGNVRATKALELIVADLGGVEMLDKVLVVLTSAFGRTVDAFDGSIMQAVAYVLNNYDPDELDVTRLIARLREIPPRQLRARAASLRELHAGTLPRLCAAVIIDRYNSQGKRVEDFFARVPERAKNGLEFTRNRNNRRRVAERDGANSPENIPADIPARATPPHPPISSSLPRPDMDICRCGHTKRRHDDGVCLVCDNCASYKNAAA
jgi:hypothetical protein